MGAQRTRTSMFGRVAAGCAVGAVVFACFAPTQIVLRFATNLQSRAPQTAIQIGTESAYKQGAGSDGRIGELVVVPSDAHDALVEVKVALGIDGTDPNACFTAPANPRCVTAKRSYRFADHETRTFDVFLSSACLGVACGAGQSCDARTRTCADIREDQTDTPVFGPPVVVSDGGQDAEPPDATGDSNPTQDSGPVVCGATAVSNETSAPRALVGTVDALFWVDTNGKLYRRAKSATGPGTEIATEVEALAATGTTVMWTKGETLFGQIGAGPTLSCTLEEPASSLALRPGPLPTSPPSAIFVSGATSMRRYAGTVASGPCPRVASFAAAPQDELVVTSDAVWGRSNVTNAVGGAPWSFASETNWMVSFPTRPLLLAASPDLAIAATLNQASDTVFYRLTSVTMVSTFATLPEPRGITGLAVDGAQVYWLETSGTSSPSTQLYRAPLASAGQPTVVAVAGFASDVSAQGLVVDDACIFTWAKLAKNPAGGGSIIGLSKNP